MAGLADLMGQLRWSHEGTRIHPLGTALFWHVPGWILHSRTGLAIVGTGLWVLLRVL